MTIARYLDRIVKEYPDRLALIFGDRRWTYAKYGRAINRLANALASIGVTQGDRIAIFHTNCPEHAFTMFASARLGAMVCPMNCRLKGDELAYVLKDCEPSVVLVGKRYADQVMPITREINTTKRTLLIDALPGDPDSLHDLLSDVDDKQPNTDVSANVTALLLYSSGTTGKPKGVLHSHQNIIDRCEGRTTAFDDPSLEKTGLLAVPMFHITGIQVVVKTVASGGMLVTMPQFKIEDFLRTVQDEGVMMACVVPTMLEQIVEYPNLDKYNIESLKVLVYGGAATAPALIRKAMDKLPCMFIQGYGLTETSITWLQPSDHTAHASADRADTLTSVGRPVPGIEVAIVDDNDNQLRQRESGEIVARGAGVMQGYWRKEEETKEAMRGGWFHTGDMGYFDDEGYLYIIGRKKDLIIRGGENIAPLEIENILVTHPAVAEAAAFGIPDPKWGEIVASAVVLRPSREATAEELIEYCRQRIASYKKPERIFFLKALPRNAAGKVLKKDLRKISLNARQSRFLDG